MEIQYEIYVRCQKLQRQNGLKNDSIYSFLINIVCLFFYTSSLSCNWTWLCLCNKLFFFVFFFFCVPVVVFVFCFCRKKKLWGKENLCLFKDLIKILMMMIIKHKEWSSFRNFSSFCFLFHWTVYLCYQTEITSKKSKQTNIWIFSLFLFLCKYINIISILTWKVIMFFVVASFLSLSWYDWNL
jgi:hypothetical protein